MFLDCGPPSKASLSQVSCQGATDMFIVFFFCFVLLVSLFFCIFGAFITMIGRTHDKIDRSYADSCAHEIFMYVFPIMLPIDLSMTILF